MQIYISFVSDASPCGQMGMGHMIRPCSQTWSANMCVYWLHHWIWLYGPFVSWMDVSHQLV